MTQDNIPIRPPIFLPPQPLARPVQFPIQSSVPSPSQDENIEEAEGDVEEVTEEEVKEEPKNEFPELVITPEAEEEMFGVSDEDISGGDMSDLFRVTKEDVMGRVPNKKSKKVRRTVKKYQSLPNTMGGMQG